MKNYFKNPFKILALISFFGFVFGCSNQQEIELDIKVSPLSGTRTFDEASEIAQTVNNNNLVDDSHARLGSKNKDIVNGYMIVDEDVSSNKKVVDTLLYVFNYENGYSIIGADKRLSDVYAYVDRGRLNKGDKIPGGILVWLNNTKNIIKAFKKSGYVLKGKKSGRIGTGQARLEVTTPLVLTSWDQGCGYNDLITSTCSSGGCGGRAWTGCVATSMAQLIKFWGDKTGRPSIYSYPSMSLTGGSPETAKLMRDAGQQANMNYGCSGSATSLNNAKNALTGFFGFTEGYYKPGTSYSYYTDYFNDLISSLYVGRPVILEGYVSANYNMFGYLTSVGEGHAWIADGYKSVYYPYSYYNYQRDRWVGSTTYYLHANWGWGGAHDGWYASTSFGTSETGDQMPADYIHNVGGLFNYTRP